VSADETTSTAYQSPFHRITFFFLISSHGFLSFAVLPFNKVFS
jgi:hypothetical protein